MTESEKLNEILLTERLYTRGLETEPWGTPIFGDPRNEEESKRQKQRKDHVLREGTDQLQLMNYIE